MESICRHVRGIHHCPPPLRPFYILTVLLQTHIYPLRPFVVMEEDSEVRGIGSWNPFVVMFVESICRNGGGQ